MPANTTDQQIQYPIGTDPADNPNAFLNMLAGVQQRLVRTYTSAADRTTRQIVVAENEISGLADVDRLDVYDGTRNVSLARRSYNNWARLSADSAPQNNTTAAVTALTCTLAPVGTPATYVFEANIIYSSSAVADIKFGFQHAGLGATLTWSAMGIANNAAGNSADMKNVVQFTSGLTDDFGGIGVGSGLCWRAIGHMTTSATADTLSLIWGQQNLDPTNTIIRTGSFLRVVRFS